MCKECLIGIAYGDFYSTNEAHPYMVDRTQRKRMWIEKASGKIIRLELSKILV